MAQDPAASCRHSPGHREPLRSTHSPPAGRGEGEEEGKLDGEAESGHGGWVRMSGEKRDQ